MGRTVINSIECGHCHKKFEVATEDLEWEKLIDLGECDDNHPQHDYAINQKVVCPHCHKENSILMKAKGDSAASPKTIEIISMEPGSYEF